MNLYAYVHNAPTGYRDPWGLVTETVFEDLNQGGHGADGGYNAQDGVTYSYGLGEVTATAPRNLWTLDIFSQTGSNSGGSGGGGLTNVLTASNTAIGATWGAGAHYAQVNRNALGMAGPLKALKALGNASLILGLGVEFVEFNVAFENGYQLGMVDSVIDASIAIGASLVASVSITAAPFALTFGVAYGLADATFAPRVGSWMGGLIYDIYH